MRRFHVREFFEQPRTEWRCLENELFEVEFDDGEIVETNTARIEVSRKLWLVHEHFDKLPILKRHFIGKGSLPYKVIQNVKSAIYKDMYKTYGYGGAFDREHLWYLLYKTSERLYNESIVEYSEYIRSVNSFDFSAVYNHPPIKELRDNLRPDSLSIEKGNKEVERILMTDPTIARNPIVSDIRAGLVKMEQLLQIIFVRGFNTDIDDNIYRQPIMGNYFAGVHDPAEAMMESTLASKSIIATGAPLEQTEYGNRKMQFTSQQIDLLVMGDCGSTQYCDIEVVITKELDRFTDMLGLNFIHPETGELKALEEEDKDYVKDKTLKFRMPFFCGYRDKNCVCSTCYGDLAYNIPYGANIGHIASTMTQSEVSQRVLKVKHSEASTVTEPIIISDEEKEFIRIAKNPSQLLLNPRLKEKGIKLLLKVGPKDRAFNGSRLPLLKKKDLQDGFSPSKHSQFREVTFDVPTQGKQLDRYRVSVSRGTRMSYLTTDFLRYFLHEHFSVQDDGFYHVDLSKWDFSKPVFELPNKHMNMRDFATEVEVFVRSTRDESNRHLGKLRQLRQYEDATEALLDLHELISSKVAVHFTHVAVVILSMMVGKHRVNDYRIPPLDEPYRFAKYDEVITGRSLGPLFAYQGAHDELTEIDQYENTVRDPHLLDPLLMPL